MGYRIVEIIDGKRSVLKDTTREAPPDRSSKLNVGVFNLNPACWPMKCCNMGVNPDQIEEAAAHDAAHGVPTEYAPDGDPIYTDPSHRKAHCELHETIDMNGGYSDPMPGGTN